ncbi:hypothetical protein CCP3SC1_1170007 [Gammaproteobacteria bacterium]
MVFFLLIINVLPLDGLSIHEGCLFFRYAQAALPVEVPGVLNLIRGAVRPGSPSGIGDFYAITGEPGGLYRSTDGVVWIQIALNLPNTYFFTVAVASNGSVYGAGSDGLFRSTDGGGTWSALPTKEPILLLLPLADGALLARTWQKGLLRSEDGGVTWYQTGAELHDNPVLSLVQDNANGLWAATFGGGVYQSTDNGITWKEHGLEKGHVLSLAMDRDGALYAGTYHNGVYRYSSSGWIPSGGRGLPEKVAVQKLAVTSAGLIAGTAQHGVYLARPGGDWVLVEGGPKQIEEITGILPMEDNRWLVATRPYGLFLVNPVTKLWKSVPLQTKVQMVAADPCGGGYAVLPDGRMLRSTPATTSKFVQRCGTDGAWEYFAQAPAGGEILFVTHDGEVFVGGRQGLSVYQLKDRESWAGGGQWQKIVLPRSDFQVTCLAETETGLIVGTRGHGLLRSMDGGVTWVPLSEGDTIRACIGIGRHLYAASDSGLSVSDDGGALWTRYPIKPPPITLAADGDRGIIFSRNGIFSSQNVRENLMTVTNGLLTPLYLDDSGEITIPAVRALAVSGGTLYAASAHGVDLFRREGTFWHWEGQALPRVIVNGLAPLPKGNAAVASDRGLFVLNGTSGVTQVPVIP